MSQGASTKGVACNRGAGRERIPTEPWIPRHRSIITVVREISHMSSIRAHSVASEHHRGIVESIMTVGGTEDRQADGNSSRGLFLHRSATS